MINKAKDWPIWLQILIPSGLIILILNGAGLIFFIFYLNTLKIDKVLLEGVYSRLIIIQTSAMLLTLVTIFLAAFKTLERVTKERQQRIQKKTFLEPTQKSEKMLVEGSPDEQGWAFKEKDSEQKNLKNLSGNFEKLIETLPLPILKIDTNGICSYMNNAALNAGIGQFFDCNSRLLNPCRSGLSELLSKKQSVKWEHDNSTYLVQPLDVQGEGTSFLCLKDMTNSEELLDKINNYDLLTKLPNRVLFMEILDRAFKSADRTEENCICILIDIDDLERINDTKGYHKGDKLLRQFAQRLEKTIRDEDTAARLSGDEFIILIPRLASEILSLDFLQRIQSELTKPFIIDDAEYSIGISMGISIYPEDGNEPEELLKKANIALSRTKKLRRGTYTIFDPKYDNLNLKRRELEIQMEEATANKEFELYYQPKVDTKTEKITGFEALLRWNRENPISPAEFIPLAEETGKIVGIGKFVIEEASRFLNRLSDRGREDLQVAINVSARQFKDPGFEKFLVDTANSHHLDFSKLELEVTEGIVATETTGALNGLASLSAQGFSIAIDDFGTGYSSMKYLQDLSFDTLKIDKSFIDRIESDSGLPIVKAIIALGKSILKKVVAEGVETQEQLDVLEMEGCDVIQGYYYSKALPEDEAIQLIESWPEYRKKEL